MNDYSKLRSMGPERDAMFQNQASLLRELQRTQDPQRAYEIQNKLQEMSVMDQQRTRKMVGLEAQKRAALGMEPIAGYTQSGAALTPQQLANPMWEGIASKAPSGSLSTGAEGTAEESSTYQKMYDYAEQYREAKRLASMYDIPIKDILKAGGVGNAPTSAGAMPKEKAANTGKIKGALAEATKEAAVDSVTKKHRSYMDPFTSSAMLTGATQDFGITDPEDIAVAKKIIQDKLTSGEPVDQASLQLELSQAIRKNKMDRLKDKVGKAKLVKELNKAMGSDEDKKKNKWGVAAMNSLDKETIELTKNTADFINIGRAFDDDFVKIIPSLMNKANTWKERFGLDLTPEERNNLGRFRNFQNQVVTAFNSYRRLITGAAASEQELRSLEKGFLHMKMSPTEFRSALKSLQAATRSKALLLMKIRNEGPRSQAIVNPGEWMNHIRSVGDSGGKFDDQIDKEMYEALKVWDTFRTDYLDKHADELSSLPGSVDQFDEHGNRIINEKSIPESKAGSYGLKDIRKASTSELMRRRQELVSRMPESSGDVGPQNIYDPRSKGTGGATAVPSSAPTGGTGNAFVDKTMSNLRAPAAEAASINPEADAVKNMSPETRRILYNYHAKKGEYR